MYGWNVWSCPRLHPIPWRQHLCCRMDTQFFTLQVGIPRSPLDAFEMRGTPGLDVDSCLASQHIQGNLNTVADLLSFSGGITRAGGKKYPIAFDNPPNDVLTQRFHMYYLEQIAKNLKISQLPRKISLWVLSVLQIAASCSTAEQKAATSPTTGPGVAGSAFAPKLDVAMSLFSISYPQPDERSSFGPTLPPFK